jgi:prolipoprotein diacylglyceryltransferase
MFHEAIHFGPFLIKYGWIAIIYSFICAYVMMRIRLQKYPFLKEEMVQIFYNSVLLGCFVWKFSIIITNPAMVIHNLYGLLYFTGGTFGGILAGLTVLFYLVRVYQTKRLPIVPYVDILLVTILSGIIAYGIHNVMLFRL